MCASVPPPAPVPMMITSKCSGMFPASHLVTRTASDARILSADAQRDKMTQRTHVDMNNR